jgi:hypothetical protein
VEPATFDPAGLLPVQAEHSACDTPEKSLWFAILSQGLEDASGAPRDVTGCSPASRHARADRLTAAARKWVASNASRPRSFRWLCEIFGLDADLVRARLKAGLPITFDRDMSAGAALHRRSEAQHYSGRSPFVTASAPSAWATSSD